MLSNWLTIGHGQAEKGVGSISTNIEEFQLIHGVSVTISYLYVTSVVL